MAGVDYLFGPFRVERASFRLLRGDQPVALTPKAFDLLLILLDNPSRVLTRAELMQRLWPDRFVEEGNLTFTMSQLRKALRDTSSRSPIETVPKRGYRLAVPVHQVAAPTNPPHAETDDVTAYRWYVQARYHWSKRTSDGLAKAIACFDRAIAANPRFARAHAGLADSYGLLALFGAKPPNTTMPRAEAAALRALELDEHLAEAHVVLGHVALRYHWDWRRAEQALSRAMTLDPKLPSAHHRYAYLMIALGRFNEAHAALERASALDPLSLIITADACLPDYFARRYDEMESRLRTALDLEDRFAHTHFYLGQCHDQQGRFDEAIAELERSLALSNRDLGYLGALGHALAAAGRRDAAKAVLHELKAQPAAVYVSPYTRALVQVGLGHHEAAMQSLGAAYEERSELLFFLAVEPRWDPLRDDPRFTRLLRAMALDSARAAAG
jgi:DNA-binding winged helix-turn-helix (wHTH) protein/Flp pilus assembly protein TadD